MKRLVALTMIMVMVLGVSVTGFAAPEWKLGGGLPPGIQKQITLAMFTKLLDLDQVSWAKNAMEKMSVKGLIKGYNDNTFKPNGSVSQLEAVVMALRIMGWEEDAIKTKTLPSKYKGGKLDSWAVGYVKVAADKGILDEVDLLYFNPNSAAKRWEVAKYFVRALGKEDIAEAHMKDKLSFKDYPAMPVGAVGYIYVMSDLGLMVGNADGTFNPNKSVSRAEMAVMLERIDGKVDRDTDENEIYGRVMEIDYDDYRLKLDVDGKQVWYQGIEGVAVYCKGEYIDLDELKRGDYVDILLNSSGKVIFIELKDQNEDKLITDYRGEIRDIDLGNREITIKAGTAIFIFTVKSDADIRLNGEDADLGDIEVGDTVRLKVDDSNRVIRLDAQGDHEPGDQETVEVEGTVYAITLGNVKGITIKLVSGRLQTYNVVSGTRITLDGRTANLSDLESGMAVEAVVEDGTAQRIDAQTDVTEVEGVITAVNTLRENITVKTDSRTTTYSIKDADIYVEDDSADIDDLMVGMTVELELINGSTVSEVHAQLEEFQGVVVSVDTDEMKITLRLYDINVTYDLDEDVEVELDGEEAGLEDLTEGDLVELEFDDGYVVLVKG